MNTLTTELTDTERAEFVMLETHIKEGLTIFYRVGDALLIIRDKRLYRDDYPNFEAYCLERWNMGRRYANMLIAAAGVVENLQGTIVPLPLHETHVRPLVSLEPEQQRTVWQVMDLTAKELGVPQSASLVKSVVSVIKSGVLTETLDGETTLTEAAKNVVVEEFYERRQRQKAHIAAKSTPPIIDGKMTVKFLRDLLKFYEDDYTVRVIIKDVSS